jgi:TATA-box binding protein (TBP) (component of TFIID and TFIIIB)
VDVNAKPRKILNGIELALRLLMWDYEIECYIGEIYKSRNIKLGSVVHVVKIVINGSKVVHLSGVDNFMLLVY